jgi:hypothetical protein
MPRALLRLARRLPGPALASPRSSTSHRRRPSRHAVTGLASSSFARAVHLLALKLAQESLSTSFTQSTAQHCFFSLPPLKYPRRSTAAASVRRRQPPTPPPTCDPVLQQHRHDSLQLTDPSNFTFLHPTVVPHSAGELKLRRRSASPSTRRYTAPQPQPRAPSAPHHPIEAS